MGKRILVIDNYDSFTFNLVQMFMSYPLEIRVIRHDKASLSELKALSPDLILISPGPKGPAQAGISLQAISFFQDKVPILGVCLGMQCINEIHGGRTCRAPLPVHGKTSLITHCQKNLFKGVPQGFKAARYHFLQALPGQGTPLNLDAFSQEDLVMAVSHKTLPLFGVQFHPESFLTEHGIKIVDNFINLVIKWQIEKKEVISYADCNRKDR